MQTKKGHMEVCKPCLEFMTGAGKATPAEMRDNPNTGHFIEHTAANIADRVRELAAAAVYAAGMDVNKTFLDAEIVDAVGEALS